MLRLISAIFLLAGLGAAGYGGLRYYEEGGLARFGVSPPEPVAVSAGAEEYSHPIDAPDAEVAASEAVTVQTVNRAARQAVNPAAGQTPDTPAFSNEPAASALPRSVSPSGFDLETVPVAYQTPQTAAIGQAFNVTFALDATGDNRAVDAIPEGEDQRIVEASARVSERVRASLVGPAFDIELVSPDIQILSRETENVWRWEVTAKEAGRQTLIVELFALSGAEALPVKTFDDEVVVSVSALRRAIGAARTVSPIIMVLGGIGSALGGFFGVFRFFRPVR